MTLRSTDREGYRGHHGQIRARSISSSARGFRIRTQERLGCLISAAGVIWAVNEATKDFAGLWKFSVLPPGPLEVCAIGILIWLHAKWRRSLTIN
jgi:hypothetical protein